MVRLGLFVPVVLSLVVLAAHFLRSSNVLLVSVVLALVVLLPLRRPWVARAVQVALVIGSIEWLRTLAVLAMRRTAAGQPVLRMALVLGLVALVTLGSALVFETATLRRLYRLPNRRDIAERNSEEERS